MSRLVFVDETKHRGYVLGLFVAVSEELEPLRRVVRGLILAGQRRVHMKDENDSRKRAIAAAIVAAGVEAVIYDAGRRYRTEREGRAECLRGLVEDAAAAPGHTRLVIEQDDSLVSWDSQRLIEPSTVGRFRLTATRTRTSPRSLRPTNLLAAFTATIGSDDPHAGQQAAREAAGVLSAAALRTHGQVGAGRCRGAADGSLRPDSLRWPCPAGGDPRGRGAADERGHRGAEASVSEIRPPQSPGKA